MVLLAQTFEEGLLAMVYFGASDITARDGSLTGEPGRIPLPFYLDVSEMPRDRRWPGPS